MVRIPGFKQVHDARNKAVRRSVACRAAGRRGPYTTPISYVTFVLRRACRLLRSDVSMEHAQPPPPDRAREEREQYYRSLFEHNPNAIFSVDRTPRFTSANPAAVRISGYSEDELLALSPGELIMPEFVERVGQAFQQALAGE